MFKDLLKKKQLRDLIKYFEQTKGLNYYKTNSSGNNNNYNNDDYKKFTIFKNRRY